MSHDLNETKKTEPDDYRESYKKALAQTISDDSFNEAGLVNLTQTISDEDPDQAIDSSDIRNVLLDTLDEGELEHKFVDFYPNDEQESFSREAATQSDDWEKQFDSQRVSIDSDSANERLVDSYIPGRYRVNALLSADKTGQVFAIHDNNLERNIAVKFLHPEQNEDYDRIQFFIQEAKKTAHLDHPGILPIHDLDFTDGALPFYTSRKTADLNLEEIIERSQHQRHPHIANPVRISSIMLQICETIAYAHDQGVVHGDVKPGNIMVGRHEDVLLVDWGTSTTAEQRAQEELKILGTPMYMSPEQARKERCDELSDVYCIGSTLFHILTLRYPLFDDNPNTFWEMKKKGIYTQATQKERERVPSALLAIAEKAMQPKAEQRYPSVEALRQDLLAFQRGGPISATLSLQRRFLSPKIFLVFILLLACVAGISAWLHHQKQSQDSDKWLSVYQENFDSYTQQDLANNWQGTYLVESNLNQRSLIDLSQESHWYVENGTLRARSPVNAPSGFNNISLKQSFGEEFKMTFDVIGYRKKPMLNVFINGQDRLNSYVITINPETHHVTLFKNLTHKIGFTKILKNSLEENKTYTYTVQRTDDRILFKIDQDTVFDFIDPAPLYGITHQTFGFESTDESTRIDNIKILRKQGASQVNSIQIADDFRSKGDYTKALSIYDALKHDHKNNSILASRASIRSAVCLIRLNKIKEAKIRLESFLSIYPNHRLRASAYDLMIDVHTHPKNFKNLEELRTRIRHDQTIDSTPLLDKIDKHLSAKVFIDTPLEHQVPHGDHNE